jgi:tRNA-Thr(GGU) m(6)t(6)A37 methyltransferase TsaA
MQGGYLRDTRVVNPHSVAPPDDLILVARVESPFTEPATAPKQGDEGGAEAWLVFQDAFLVALDGLRPGDAVIVLTWLHRAEREVLRVHSRDDPGNPERGVFTTRSADRPNPVRLHERWRSWPSRGRRVLVGAARAVDGTPVLDLKRCPAGLGPASVTVGDIYGDPPWPDLAVAKLRLRRRLGAARPGRRPLPRPDQLHHRRRAPRVGGGRRLGNPTWPTWSRVVSRSASRRSCPRSNRGWH